MVEIVLGSYVHTESYLTLKFKMWSNFMCTQDPFSHAGSHNMVASFTALQLFSAYNLVT